MTKKKILTVFFTVTSLIIFGSFLIKGIVKPKSYEECIMKSMDGVQSDIAARLKANACRSMFPKPDAFDIVNKMAK